MEGSQSANPAPPNQSQPPANQERRTLIRFLLSNREAGVVIGRGASTIRSIKSTSGAIVQVTPYSQCFPGTDKRMLMVAGTVGRILHAVDLILTELMNLVDVDESTVILLVPDVSCGAIIGHHSAALRSLAQDSQAVIEVCPLDRNHPGLHDRLTKVTGTLQKRMRAIELILLRLAKNTSYKQYVRQFREVNNGPYDVVPNLDSLPNRLKWMGSFGIEDKYVGLVIGRHKSTINRIKGETGAKIKVSRRGDFMAGTLYREVTITAGSPAAVQAAQYMIQEKIASAVDAYNSAD